MIPSSVVLLLALLAASWGASEVILTGVEVIRARRLYRPLKEVPVAKKKSTSRASRCADATQQIREAIGKAEAVRDAIKLALDERIAKIEEHKAAVAARGDSSSCAPDCADCALPKDLPGAILPLEVAADPGPAEAKMDLWIAELDAAASAAGDGVSELDSLREEVEECAEGLDNAVDSGQQIDLADVSGAIAAASEYSELEEALENLQEAIDSLTECADEADGLEFPGMF